MLSGCIGECETSTTHVSDPVSVGPITPDERLYRAAFSPTNANASSGRLKASYIRRRDLWAGELSVWRVNSDGTVGRDDVEGPYKFAPPAKADVCAVHYTEAGRVEALRAEGVDGKLFCVIDDVVAGDDGDKHPRHAAIALCRKLKGQIGDASSPHMDLLIDVLRTEFQQNTAI